MVQIEGLVKVFKGRSGSIRAVDGMSFSANPGEIVAVLGPNGAGKTTCFRMLVGVLKPDSGTILINQEPPEKAKNSVGFLPADSGLYARLTPREVLWIFGRLARVEKEELRNRIDELRDALQMGDFMDRRIRSLSTGMKQRVAVARCLVHDPDVLIMDEPTRGLDVESSIAVEEALKKARNDGRTVLFSTHIMEEAEYLADRIVVVNHGKVMAQGSVEQLRQMTKAHKLREVYLKLVRGEK